MSSLSMAAGLVGDLITYSACLRAFTACISLSMLNLNLFQVKALERVWHSGAAWNIGLHVLAELEGGRVRHLHLVLLLDTQKEAERFQGLRHSCLDPRKE